MLRQQLMSLQRAAMEQRAAASSPPVVSAQMPPAPMTDFRAALGVAAHQQQQCPGGGLPRWQEEFQPQPRQQQVTRSSSQNLDGLRDYTDLE